MVLKQILFEAPKGLYLAYHGYHPRMEATPENIASIDLKEICYDISWDSDTAPNQGHDLPRWRIETIDVPEEIEGDVKRYCEEFFYIAGFVGFFNWDGRDTLKENNLTLEMRKNLYQLYRDNRKTCFVIADLLKVKNMRSEFRIQMKAQLLQYLQEKEHKYPSPWSIRQENVLIGRNVDLQRSIRYAGHERIRFFV